MTKTAKILLGVGGGLVILAVIGIVVLILAMNYVEKNLTAGVKADMEAGKEFAKTTDQKGCMTESLRRSKEIGFLNIGQGTSLGAFAEECFKAAKPTPDLCGVPGFWSLTKSDWIADECKRVGLDQQKTGCFYVFQAKHGACNPLH